MATHIVVGPDKKIVNRIALDRIEDFTPPEDHSIFEADGEIGYIWDGEKAIDPNPPASTADAPVAPRGPSETVQSISRMVLAGHKVEFAYFKKVGKKISWHVHDDGHFSILVSGGPIIARIKGTEDRVLKEVGDTIYFPAGVEHELEAETDDSVCLQVHDKRKSPT